MKRFQVIAVIIIALFTAAHPGLTPLSGKTTPRINWFHSQTIAKLKGCPGVYLIPDLKGFQQTTDYTCGPAALMVLAAWYKTPGISTNKKTELHIAKEAGTRALDVPPEQGKPGTTPKEMATWLETHGFKVELSYEDKGDYAQLKKLKKNLRAGIPTIVEWVDMGGHWVVAVGYDSRNTLNPLDDVLIFADSYDHYDDQADGYSIVNADKFYWMWFDAIYFDKLTWRTMITATPAK